MLDQLLAQLAALGGLAVLIAWLVNLLKIVGIVKDGTAQTWTAGFNLVALALLWAARIWYPGLDVEGLDEALQAVLVVALPVLNWLVSLLISKLTHAAFRDVPWIGKSYSK